MKILHINSYFSGSGFYKNLYEKQKRDGLEIDVYVPVPVNMQDNHLKLGDYINVRKNHGKYDRLFFHIKHSKIYNDIIKEYAVKDYSIIHAHSLFSNGYIALKLKKEYGVPYIVAVRNTDINVFFKYMVHLRKLGVEILEEAQKVILLSKPYMDLVIDKYVPERLKKEISDKMIIIPNGIDDFWLNNKAVPKSCHKENDLRLIYVGAIDRNKNILTTIKAIEILRKKGFNVNFTIVGRIADKQIYQKLAGLTYVNYLGIKPKEELINIYRENDIFVMPSITETFGLVYPEAMSQGLPVIYTRGQGFDGHFKEGEVGYSVNCHDEAEIALKILDIANNYEEISERCIKAVSKFNWSMLESCYRQIYEECTNS
jgi:glycosyltransferase involved in cell wall biosynthesis